MIAIGWHTQCYASVNSTCPSLSNQHSYPLKAYRYPQKNTAERMLLIESGLPGLTIAVVDEFSNAFQLTSTFGLTKLEPSSNLDFSPSFICVYSNNVTKVEASLKKDYKEYRTQGEWFDIPNLSFREVDAKVSKYEQMFVHLVVIPMV